MKTKVEVTWDDVDDIKREKGNVLVICRNKDYWTEEYTNTLILSIEEKALKEIIRQANLENDS